MDKEKEIKAYLDGELLPEVRMKYEIAEEMGLLDRVLSDGWKSLSAKETGRIGGLMTKRKKKISSSYYNEQREESDRKEAAGNY